VLFDAYASNFDASLQDLQYQVPRLIAETISQLSAAQYGEIEYDSRDRDCRNDSSEIELMSPPNVRILDLGAGTGLVCEELKKVTTIYFHMLLSLVYI